MLERYKNHIVAALLGVMLILGLSSMRDEAGIVDEVAHIPSGYSYLKYLDYRLNPEHPPLLKDIAGYPLLFMDLDFPDNIPAWTTEPNGQWESGWHFIYHFGNNADAILFWSRLPLFLLGVAFGYILYEFTRSRFGTHTALLTLFFYTLSPTILAHSRYVTTDMGIMVFTFLAFAAFWKYLESPGKKSLLWAAIFFALAQLAKFSGALLVPLFILLAVIAALAANKPKTLKARLKLYIGGLFKIFIIGAAIIYIVYIPHTWNMSHEIQDKLIENSLTYGFGSAFRDPLIAINEIPGMKPLVQYLLGFLMVFNRVRGGNTTYFLGMVTNTSFLLYFPVSYLIKTQVALHLLTLSAVWITTREFAKKKAKKILNRAKDYARGNIVVLSSSLFIAYYSYLSITGNLNLGIRHLMPIMPFIFLVVAKKTVDGFSALSSKNVKFATLTLGLLLFWYAGSTVTSHPFYLAYFNELIGGPGNAAAWVSDSNVDWGQDLIRFKKYVDSHPEIDKIAVDYFGGGDAKYYFCDRRFDERGDLIKNTMGYDCSNSKYIEWHADDGVPPTDYIAVSETYLTNDIYWAQFREDQSANYQFLRDMEPIAKIGWSIYVYKLR